MIAVIIPSYKVRDHILGVLACIGPEVGKIYVIDDACPQGTGNFVKENCSDDRVEVICNPKNLGVGGAVIAGYKKALEDGCTIMVKLEGARLTCPFSISKVEKSMWKAVHCI